MNRRTLLRNIAAGTATFFVVPGVLTSCEEEEPIPDNNPQAETLTIDLSETQNSVLTAAGGYKYVGNMIILNTGTDPFSILRVLC